MMKLTVAFLAALASGHLHHAWLIAGPEGVGKATFAQAAALRMLAEGAAEPLPPGLAVPEGSRTRALVELVAGGAVFLAVVLVTAHLLRVREVAQLLDPVLRRVRRGGPTGGTA